MIKNRKMSKRYTATQWRKWNKRKNGNNNGKMRLYKNPSVYLERKFIDTEVNAFAFATTWTTMEDTIPDCISSVAQADTESSRDGRVYTILSVYLKMKVFVQAQEESIAPLPDIIGRVVLVLDTQTNKVQLTATDVMDASATADELAFRNLHNTKRFKVFWDHSFKIDLFQVSQGAINLFAHGQKSTEIVTYYKKFNPPIVVKCIDQNATVASVSDNSLHIIGVANGSQALLTMTTRCRFIG